MRPLKCIIAISLLAGLQLSSANADDFFVQKGMDARTGAKVNRTIADHYARDDVKRLSPSTVTEFNGGGQLNCQQGVIQQTGQGQQDTGDIVLLRPTNVCINR